MRRGLLCIALELTACVAVPDGDPDVADSDDDAIDDAIDEAVANETARDDETPLQAYLRERRGFYDMVGKDPPRGAEERRELRKIARQCRDGEQAAASELEQGQFGVALFGLPADCIDHLARAAWDRYTVAYHMMGCVIDDSNAPFASCYNHVMSHEIAKAHGPNVLDDLRKEICERPRATPADSD
jgi:hypothetical protein